MITEIKWNNHPVLGNLKLNLTKSDGTPYKTIVKTQLPIRLETR